MRVSAVDERHQKFRYHASLNFHHRTHYLSFDHGICTRQGQFDVRQTGPDWSVVPFMWYLSVQLQLHGVILSRFLC